MRTWIFLVLGLIASACQSPVPSPSSSTETALIPFTEHTRGVLLRDGVQIHALRLEIADNDSSRERGLMGRGPLASDEGMLFLFDQPAQQGFWMANTPSSLDILFLSADSVVLNIARYTRPFSTETVLSEGPAKYVLELGAGMADRYGISPGDRLRWSWP